MGSQSLPSVEGDISFFARVDFRDVDRKTLKVELLSDEGGYFDLGQNAVFDLTNEKLSVGEIGRFDCLTVWDGGVKEYYILDFERIDNGADTDRWTGIEEMPVAIIVNRIPSELRLGIPFYAEFSSASDQRATKSLEIEVLEILLDEAKVNSRGIVSTASLQIEFLDQSKGHGRKRAICILENSKHSRIPIRIRGTRGSKVFSKGRWVSVLDLSGLDREQAAYKVLKGQSLHRKLGPIGDLLSGDEYRVMERVFSAYGDTEVGALVEFALLSSEHNPMTVEDRVERLRILAESSPSYLGIQAACLEKATELERD